MKSTSRTVCIVQFEGYRVGTIRALPVCPGRWERVRCFGMNREAMGSFLFIEGLIGRCSPVDGGCTIGEGFDERAGGEVANFGGVAGVKTNGVVGRADD